MTLLVLFLSPFLFMSLLLVMGKVESALFSDDEEVDFDDLLAHSSVEEVERYVATMFADEIAAAREGRVQRMVR